MPNPDFHVPKVSLAFAKIVATPTKSTWSQVYNAGSLFAILALSTKTPESDEITLPSIGKNIFNNLEAEFFSLQEKNIRSIKTAVEKSFENLDEAVEADACLAYFKNNILYLFLVGKGKIIMKRNDKLGTLIEKRQINSSVLTASGFLETGDTILLQTGRFAQNITPVNISEAFKLQLPNDIAETLAPHIHEKEDGGQAAIIITFNGAGKTRDIPEPIEQSPLSPPPSPIKIEEEEISPSPKKPRFKLPRLFLTRLQKTAIIISVLILIILAASIIITKTNEDNTKNQTRYTQLIASAQKNYDQGKELIKLNESLAKEDFQKAKDLLEKNLDTFKAGSKERVGIQAFLNKIEKELNTSAQPVNKITPKVVEIDENDFLSIQQNNRALAYAQDDKSVYVLTQTDVTTIDKTTGKKNVTVKNNKDWTAPAALSSYLGNIYIVDKKAGVLKFVAGQDGFGKTAYFKTTPPDLSKAKSIAIDGSVWILTSEGKILKYTSGEPDQFTISGLTTPLKNPSRIFTDTQIDNLYILDNGNARIIKLSKTGAYQKQYNADILAAALDFEISENDKNALILSENKIYSISL